MNYPIAERFKAPQGEGLYTGTEMAFIRTVGCSVGQKVCTACDTDFDRMREDLGGGLYTPEQLVEWAAPCKHVCITGGEPLDRDLRPLLLACDRAKMITHIETSGTVHPTWLGASYGGGKHPVQLADGSWEMMHLWVCVSPKPGYLDMMVDHVADEIKVILGGLGDHLDWPTVEVALRWADKGKLVYVQPRNERLDIDRRNLDEALEVVARYPQLRLSVQLHKFLRTR